MSFAKFVLLIALILISQFAQAQKVEIVASGLDHPWSFVFEPNGNILLSERSGNLLRIDPFGNKTKIKGLPKIKAIGQGGLLGLAWHPKKSNLLYFAYVAGDDKYSTRIARGELKANILTKVKTIFKATASEDSGYHFGGRLVFDKLGFLYLSLGDRGKRSLAQDLTNNNGSIIRLNADGTIPKSNPFVGSKGKLPEIYSYGHRNIQGLAIHPVTGELWAHEHGPQGGDELNIINAGRNYGWPTITYGVNYGWGTKIGVGFSKEGMEQPIVYWVPSIAPSGLAFFKNSWLVGALKLQHVNQVEKVSGKWQETNRLFVKQFGRIRDLKIKNNALYLITDSSNGKLLKITDWY